MTGSYTPLSISHISREARVVSQMPLIKGVSFICVPHHPSNAHTDLRFLPRTCSRLPELVLGGLGSGFWHQFSGGCYRTSSSASKLPVALRFKRPRDSHTHTIHTHTGDVSSVDRSCSAHPRSGPKHTLKLLQDLLDNIFKTAFSKRWAEILH